MDYSVNKNTPDHTLRSKTKYGQLGAETRKSAMMYEEKYENYHKLI